MIGSFLTRGLAMVFGYAYPAYECFKTVERNKPDIEQLRFWCQYWILVAAMTICERIGDTFISWVPMYYEAKLAFFVYLWFPKTKGTTYVYDAFFRPYIAKHESEIDRNLLELRTRAGDIALLYWQRAASYSQTRIFEILQYVAAQSTPRPRPNQAPQQGGRDRQSTAAPTPKPPPATISESEEPASPTSSTSSSQPEEEVPQELSSSQAPKPASPAAMLNSLKASITQTPSKTIIRSKSNDTEATQTGADSSTSESVNTPTKETAMEEAVRVTRARLRKTRSGGNR